MICIVGGDWAEKLASSASPGKWVTSLTQRPDVVPGSESAPVQAPRGGATLASKPTCQHGVAPGRTPYGGLFLRCLLLPCALGGFLVMSKKGTVVGVRADGNLKEPFRLILSTTGQMPALGGGGSHVLTAPSPCPGARSYPCGEHPRSWGSSMFEACVRCAGRLRTPGRAPRCVEWACRGSALTLVLPVRYSWASRIHPDVFSFQLAEWVSVYFPT